jgi:hypothetical protein
MVPDPFTGDTFVMPEALCTPERKSWFNRANKIVAIQKIIALSLQEYRNNNEKKFSNPSSFKENTPIKIESEDGTYIAVPVWLLFKLCSDGIAIMNNQLFVMLYGSFETYLFEMFETTYPRIGITEKTLNISLDILMNKKWDGKFCKMSQIFKIDYRTSKLVEVFSGFKMDFMGITFKNPLEFLDELAKIRHRIIHASSIINRAFADKYQTENLEQGKQINIPQEIIPTLYGFYVLLTDYIDDLFANKYGYKRIKIKPSAT